MTHQFQFTYSPAECPHVDSSMVDDGLYYLDVEIWLTSEKIDYGVVSWNENYVSWDYDKYTDQENDEILEQAERRKDYLIKELQKHYEQQKVDV